MSYSIERGGQWPRVFQKTVSVLMSALIFVSAVSPSVQALAKEQPSVPPAPVRVESLVSSINAFMQSFPFILSSIYTLIVRLHTEELRNKGIAFNSSPSVLSSQTSTTRSITANDTYQPLKTASNRPSTTSTPQSGPSSGQTPADVLQTLLNLKDSLSVTTALDMTTALLEKSKLEQKGRDASSESRAEDVDFATLWSPDELQVSFDEKETASKQKTTKVSKSNGGGTAIAQGSGSSQVIPELTPAQKAAAAEEKKKAEEVISNIQNLPTDPTPGQILDYKKDRLEKSAVERKETLAAPEEKKTFLYAQLMRDVRDTLELFSTSTNLTEPEKTQMRTDLVQDLEVFKNQEDERLKTAGVSYLKRQEYLNLLDAQSDLVQGKVPEKSTVEKVKEFFGIDEKVDENEVLIPEKPGSFDMVRPPETIQKPDDVQWEDYKEESDRVSFEGPRSLPIAKAMEEELLPVIEEVQADGNEVIINSTIEQLAQELNHNPVTIFNFVRNLVSYEPYFGAKKGSLGCLKEQICNDIDASSLMVALLRASGIPARYGTATVLIEVNQLKTLLGVDQTKTVYASMSQNGVPLVPYPATNFDTQQFDTYNFNTVTHFAVPWHFVELFYEYDERGGNISNALSFTGDTTTEQVRDKLRDSLKKQWIRVDTIFKPYTATHNEIVPDTASFNATTFVNSYLQYQGELSPTDKLKADLIAAVGKDITRESYQSFNTAVREDLDVLPPKTIYEIVSLTLNGQTYFPLSMSAVPDFRKQKVKIKLSKNGSSILEHTFFGSEINNVELNLEYEGATQADKDEIESHGGIFATSAPNVYIKPFLQTDTAQIEGTSSVRIGDALVLQFDYSIGTGPVLHTDQKFSVAGNSEGIYIALSRVQPDPSLDSNSSILLRGNVGLGREYLKRVSSEMELYAKAFDITNTIQFSRAVITQNRVLTPVNGFPTTFDFKGLSIDAAIVSSDSSNRGAWDANVVDIFRLNGMMASYHESHIFEDVAGLESISTVSGLQYAYANPGTYTVHTITSGNEGVIDTLTLSPNTKQNMHSEVQQGRTVTTPDKLVQRGTWSGVVYLVAHQDGSSRWAIGEQAMGNGGYTFTVTYNGRYLGEVHSSTEEGRIFTFDDAAYGGTGISCSISRSAFEDFPNQGWQESYGLPCMSENWNVGVQPPTTILNPSPNIGNILEMYRHKVLLATKAAKLTRQGKYDHWVRASQAKSIIEGDFESRGIHSYNDLGFSPVFGTYMVSGIRGNVGQYGFYAPALQQSESRATLAYGEVYTRLIDNNGYYFSYGPNCIPLEHPECIRQRHMAYQNSRLGRLLGFPISERRDIGTTNAGTTGYMQEFNGGAIFKKTNGKNKMTYSVEPFVEYRLGKEASMGMSLYDPLITFTNTNRIVEDRLNIYQLFENGRKLTLPFNTLEVEPTYERIVISYPSINLNMTQSETEDFAEGFSDMFSWQGVAGIAIGSFLTTRYLYPLVSAYVTKMVAAEMGAAAAAIYVGIEAYVGWILVGAGLILVVADNLPYYTSCRSSYPTDGKGNYYYCGLILANAILISMGMIGAGAGAVLAKESLMVSSLGARNAKWKLFEMADSPDSISLVKEVLSLKGVLPPELDSLGMRIALRTAFLEKLNSFSLAENAALMNNPKLMSNMASTKELDTWKGIILPGANVSPNLVGQQLLITHPKYKNHNIGGKEFERYGLLNQFADNAEFCRQTNCITRHSAGLIYESAGVSDPIVRVPSSQNSISFGNSQNSFNWMVKRHKDLEYYKSIHDGVNPKYKGEIAGVMIPNGDLGFALRANEWIEFRVNQGSQYYPHSHVAALLDNNFLTSPDRITVGPKLHAAFTMHFEFADINDPANYTITKIIIYDKNGHNQTKTFMLEKVKERLEALTGIQVEIRKWITD